MPRTFNGQIHIRISPEIHRQIAREAFEQGTSISGILAQAVVIRQTLKEIDPWKSIQEVHSANNDVSAEIVDREVSRALKAVRKARRESR
jgi:hypothetical protein